LRKQGDAQASRRFRETPEQAGPDAEASAQALVEAKDQLMDETEADRPAQAADRRKDRPEERNPRHWSSRKREVEADGSLGKSYPARLHGFAFG
jgi:hypothetical protein